jgi:hypothetical protein
LTDSDDDFRERIHLLGWTRGYTAARHLTYGAAAEPPSNLAVLAHNLGREWEDAVIEVEEHHRPGDADYGVWAAKIDASPEREALWTIYRNGRFLGLSAFRNEVKAKLPPSSGTVH